MKYLVEQKKYNLEELNKDGNSPLHLAALNGQLKVLQYMVRERGCDPVCRGQNESSTLHLACKSGCHEMVKYLIEEGNVDPMSTDTNGIIYSAT